jgi:hypothetical protein
MGHKSAIRLGAILCGILLLASPSFADDPIPTPVWTDFYGAVTVDGAPAQVGTIVEAFDPTGVICGRFIVSSIGLYGFMPVYGDDSQTAGVDEGATSGEALSFTVNGIAADLLGPSDAIWVTGPTIPKNLDLSVGAMSFGIEAVTLPGDQNASPLQLVEVSVEFRNTGNATDFYSVTATSLLGWDITLPAALYVASGATGTLTFTVLVPAEAKDVADQVDYTVSSGQDPTKNFGGSMNIFVVATDVDDDNEIILPSEFTLGQNYPNPFNPTTKIPYALHVTADVTLTVYDISGRKIETRALGIQGAGEHVIEFSSDGLASGVYLYKLSAGEFSQTLRMVLLK